MTILVTGLALVANFAPVTRSADEMIRIYVPLQMNATSLEATPLGAHFNQVTSISAAADERLRVAERAGIIKMLYPDGRITTFLDLSDRVLSNKGEYGLYDVIFHPGYDDPDSPGFGMFYVTYTTGYDFSTDDRDVDLILSRFHVAAGTSPEVPEDETILLRLPQSWFIHKAGDMDFDRETELLYVSIGDDHDRWLAQDPQRPNGKVLRLAVNSVPRSDVGEQSDLLVPEVWAMGLRNPWRIDVDEASHALYLGDVGEHLWEEINYMTLADQGANFGWPCMEGPDQTPESIDHPECRARFEPAITQYRHLDGRGHCAVIGGKVYRPAGNALDGRYIFGDICSREIFSVRYEDAMWQRSSMARLGELGPLSTFGEDQLGNLYLGTAAPDAPIYRLTIH